MRGSASPIAAVHPWEATMQADEGAERGPSSLAELEGRIARDLEMLLIPPPKAWLARRVHPEWGPMLDVAIVGAGMAGLSAAFALKRLGVGTVRLFDRACRGREGPWL